MSAEIVTNRKALRDYHILETFEAGIELKGTEVKSIRSGLVNLQGSFARLEGGEVFLYDSDIQPYLRASHEQHEPGAAEGFSCTARKSTSSPARPNRPVARS